MHFSVEAPILTSFYQTPVLSLWQLKMSVEGNFMVDNSNKELSFWDAVLGEVWDSCDSDMSLQKKV